MRVRFLIITAFRWQQNMYSAPLLGLTPTVNYRDQLVNITVVYIICAQRDSVEECLECWISSFMLAFSLETNGTSWELSIEELEFSFLCHYCNSISNNTNLEIDVCTDKRQTKAIIRIEASERPMKKYTFNKTIWQFLQVHCKRALPAYEIEQFHGLDKETHVILGRS